MIGYRVLPRMMHHVTELQFFGSLIEITPSLDFVHVYKMEHFRIAYFKIAYSKMAYVKMEYRINLKRVVLYCL